MRYPTLLLILLLTACATSPRPLATSSAPPDFQATAFVAGAAANYSVTQTQAAAMATQAERAAQTTALAATQGAVGTLVAISQTQSALQVTALRVQQAQATDTQQALSGQLTAAAAGPAATATVIAQAKTESDQRYTGYAWTGVLIVVVLLIAWGIGSGLRRLIISLGIKREMEAEAQLLTAQAEAYRIRSQALRAATILHTVDGNVLVLIGGRVRDRIPIAANQPIPVPTAQAGTSLEAAIKTNAVASATSHLSHAQQEMLAFVEAAIRVAKARGRSNYIPTDSLMGYGGSDWSNQVNVLKTLGVVRTRRGRPGPDEYGTELVPQAALDLDDLKAKLEQGSILVPVPTTIIMPPTLATTSVST